MRMMSRTLIFTNPQHDYLAVVGDVELLQDSMVLEGADPRDLRWHVTRRSRDIFEITVTD